MSQKQPPDAETEAQRRISFDQLDGVVSKKIDTWRTNTIAILAFLEAVIDFNDQDLGDTEVVDMISDFIKVVKKEIDTFQNISSIKDGIEVAIIGPPNVGKSTLFNALTTTAAAEAANYPFCTIEPNTGRVSVPDTRLEKIAALANSSKIIPTQLEFVDIAGLVKGASKGEGLGNQFLANIRETDAIIHVLRCFEDENITHVDGNVQPLRDIETIETELMLADLESLERRIISTEKKARSRDKEIKADLLVMNKVLDTLQQGIPARKISEWDSTEFL